MVQVHVPSGVEVRVLFWAPDIISDNIVSNPLNLLSFKGIGRFILYHKKPTYTITLMAFLLVLLILIKTTSSNNILMLRGCGETAWLAIAVPILNATVA